MPNGETPSPDPGFRRLLLAVELPVSSGAPEARALALAAELRASVVVVSVLESRAHLPANPGRVDQLREVHERAAHDLAARGRAMGVTVDYLIWQGDPADSIIEAASSELVDLIVIGAPAGTPSRESCAWSVSDEVLRRAPVPVLVVPDPSRPAPAST
jgi:nucleotide-binding universal stress UspA family protein